MEPWVIGLIAVLMVGVAVIAYGAVHDRNRNRRAAEAVLAPPNRTIPGYVPGAPPHYMSELQARRPPPEASPSTLSEREREEIRTAIRARSTLTVAAGYLSKDFVADVAEGWATLADPRVLVCAEPVQTVRELLVVLPGTGRAGPPLVVVAPAYAAEVRGTLEVNVIQRRLALIAVVADEAGARRIAEVTGADPVPRSDLQAGYLPPAAFGHCERWVASARQSHIITGEAS